MECLLGRQLEPVISGWACDGSSRDSIGPSRAGLRFDKPTRGMSDSPAVFRKNLEEDRRMSAPGSGEDFKPYIAADAEVPEFRRVLFRSDRKSTRLNSSHLVISYAVFCF